MDYEKILYEVRDGVAVITLNDPDRLNAMTPPMLAEIRDALARSGRDREVRCLVLTGAGRGFCAGADLSGRRASSEEPDALQGDTGAGLKTQYHPIVRAIREMPKPVVSAVNGPAAGAGMSLAITADFVFAARSGYFLQAFRNIGLIPDCGSTYLLPRLIGMPRAIEMMMLGERVPAEKALAWGMIYRVTNDEALMDEVMDFAAALAKGPTKTLAYIKEALHASLANGYEDQLVLEANFQNLARATADSAEGALAFLEKRPPNFVGR